MRTELKSLLRSCAFSAAVLFTGASASAGEYVLTVAPVENDKDKFQIKCVNIDKCCTDMLSVVRDLSKKQVLLGTPPSGEVVVNLNKTSFSFEIGSFKFCYTFSSYGGVMKITGGKETDSLQIQNLIDNQTFEINAIKANMLSITRGSYKTEVIKMHNCNANTVLLTDYGAYKRLLFKTSKGDYIHKVIDMSKGLLLNANTVLPTVNANTVLPTDYGAHERLLFKTSEGDYIHKVIDVYKELLLKTIGGDLIGVYKELLLKMIWGDLIGVYEEPLLKTSGENYIHNLILNGAHIWNDGMMKVDGIFCNVDGSVEGCLPSVFFPHPKNRSPNALILRDKDLVKDGSTPEEVDSTSKNCTFFSDTSDPRVEDKDPTPSLLVKHKDSFYELPEEGRYRFILLGNFKCSGEKDNYCLLRKEDFHLLEYSTGGSSPVAYLPDVFETCLRLFEPPAAKEGQYNTSAFVSLFKNVRSVNLQIGKKLNHAFYQSCELKCASMGHALVIIREDALHQEPQQEPHQEESSPFFNEIKKRLMFFQ